MKDSHESTPLLASKRLSDGSFQCSRSVGNQPENEDVVISKTPQKKEKYLTYEDY